jgi:hypothetical protein
VVRRRADGQHRRGGGQLQTGHGDGRHRHDQRDHLHGRGGGLRGGGVHDGLGHGRLDGGGDGLLLLLLVLLRRRLVNDGHRDLLQLLPGHEGSGRGVDRRGGRLAHILGLYQYAKKAAVVVAAVMAAVSTGKSIRLASVDRRTIE